jgi:hypothetical protein
MNGKSSKRVGALVAVVLSLAVFGAAVGTGHVATGQAQVLANRNGHS